MNLIQHLFTRKQRLTKKSDFASMYASASKRTVGPLLIHKKQNSLGYSRLGLSIPKRVGTAPKRNSIKRLCREAFRLSQIENEGNDPTESGMSYGTPHDLASLYGNKRDKAVGPAQIPTGYDEKEPGRPVEKPQNYGSDKGNLSRDPLGIGGYSVGKVEKQSDGNKVSTFEIANLKKSLQKIKNKKQILKEEDENGLLSEKNIKPQE